MLNQWLVNIDGATFHIQDRCRLFKSVLMEKYNNTFEFTVSDSSKTKEKLKSYFNSYDFDQVKDEKENLLFVKKWSILNGWELNPLNWHTMMK